MGHNTGMVILHKYHITDWVSRDRRWNERNSYEFNQLTFYVIRLILHQPKMKLLDLYKHTRTADQNVWSAMSLWRLQWGRLKLYKKLPLQQYRVKQITQINHFDCFNKQNSYKTIVIFISHYFTNILIINHITNPILKVLL